MGITPKALAPKREQVNYLKVLEKIWQLRSSKFTSRLSWTVFADYDQSCRVTKNRVIESREIIKVFIEERIPSMALKATFFGELSDSLRISKFDDARILGFQQWL